MRLMILLLIMLMSSCSIFKKSKVERSEVQVRDSVATTLQDEKVEKLVVQTEDSTLLEIVATGFERLIIDSNGSVVAEGKTGELKLNKKEGAKKSVAKVDSALTLFNHIEVRDSTDRQEVRTPPASQSGWDWFKWTGWGMLIIIAIVVYILIRLKKS